MPYGVPWKQLASDTRHKLNEDNVFNGAAALGFYLTLAIFPAMIFTMAVIPYLPIPRVDEAIMDFIRQSLPPAAASMFGEVVNEVMRERRGGLLSFGILATLWATSTGMYAVMMQLNIIYRVKEGRPFIKARLTALGLSLMFIVLVLGAFSLVVLGGVIQDWIGERWGYHSALLTFFVVFRWVVIVLALVSCVRADVLPRAQRQGREVPLSFPRQLCRRRPLDAGHTWIYVLRDQFRRLRRHLRQHRCGDPADAMAVHRRPRDPAGRRGQRLAARLPGRAGRSFVGW
jgi:YihY family inner membrane protein